MNQFISTRNALRSATTVHHERVDLAFGAYDLSDRKQYGAFLKAQAAGLLPVEMALDHGRAEAVLRDWPERRRSSQLLSDLTELGETAEQWRTSQGFHTREEILGAIYVLEGSRLGGGLLARSVPAHFPRRFLSGHNPKLWRVLVRVLDSELISSEQLACAIDAACRVFALFESGAKRHARTT